MKHFKYEYPAQAGHTGAINVIANSEKMARSAALQHVNRSALGQLHREIEGADLRLTDVMRVDHLNPQIVHHDTK